MALNPYQAPRSRGELVEEHAHQPVKIFSTTGRIGRVRYLAYGMGLSAIMMLGMLVLFALVGAMGFAAGTSGDTGGAVGFVAGMFIMGIVLFIASGFVFVVHMLLTVQRCHDFDMSGWLALLVFVPLGALVFYFVPGTRGPNRWGNPPPPNTPGVIATALIIPVIFIGLIIAAVVMGTYIDKQGYEGAGEETEIQQLEEP